MSCGHSHIEQPSILMVHMPLTSSKIIKLERSQPVFRQTLKLLKIDMMGICSTSV